MPPVMFCRLVRMCGRIVCRFGQGHQPHLASGVVDELQQGIARDVAANDLENFFVAHECLEPGVGAAGQQDADGIG